MLVDADCQADNSVSLKQMCGSATNEESSYVCLKIGYTMIYHPKSLIYHHVQQQNCDFAGILRFQTHPQNPHDDNPGIQKLDCFL